MTGIETISVALGARSYDIQVGQALMGAAGKHLAGVLARPRTVIVTDQNVARLHLEALVGGLRLGGIEHHIVVLPPGEASKSLAELGHLLDQLLEAKVERHDTILALGGGVIGDLVGFAASILRRGVDFVQIPTTLLAQVDSSVGGKTGINAKQGKNLIGSFHQPRLVLADVGVLDTLPRRELLAGYAEVVKYGLLGNADFFAWLEQHGQSLLEGDMAARCHAVATACRAKAAIVARDERESGDRALLNLGHTFGHALEAEHGFSDRLLHGEAVAIGMVLAFELSALLGLCPGADVERVRRHLAAVGLPTSPATSQAGFSATRLYQHMLQDKKVRDGRTTFVLARGIGQAFLSRDVLERDVLTVLERELAA